MKLNELKEKPHGDVITLNVPLFIRVLEFAREDAKSDIDLHVFTENALTLLTTKSVLSMEDYELLLKRTTNETK